MNSDPFIRAAEHSISIPDLEVAEAFYLEAFLISLKKPRKGILFVSEDLTIKVGNAFKSWGYASKKPPLRTREWIEERLARLSEDGMAILSELSNANCLPVYVEELRRR